MTFEQILDVVSYGMLIIVSLVAFSALLKYVIPRVSLRVRYALEKSLGRGLKTYKYPTGRAVLYEPHPAIRKYINKYLLFVNDGYKYFKCTLDDGVRAVKLEIVMLSNGHKVIDVLTVSMQIDAQATSPEVLLHPETSYIAINLQEVNGSSVKRLMKAYYSVWQLTLYFILVCALTFLEINTVSTLAVKLFMVVLKLKSITILPLALYLLSSFAVAAAAVFFVVIGGRKKGIEVVFNGKK